MDKSNSGSLNNLYVIDIIIVFSIILIGALTFCISNSDKDILYHKCILIVLYDSVYKIIVQKILLSYRKHLNYIIHL